MVVAIVSKRRLDYLTAYAAAYENAESIIDGVKDVILSPVKNAQILQMLYNDVDVEAGIVVGINNPYYDEIKELALKGMK